MGSAFSNPQTDPMNIHPPKRSSRLNELSGIALIALGVGIVVFGNSAFDPSSMEVVTFSVSLPTGKPIWLSVGGLVLAGIGFFAAAHDLRN